MELLYYLLAFGAAGMFGTTVAGLIRPSLFQKYLKRFATRRHILIGGTLLMFLLSGLSAAAEPASIKQARLERERIAAEQRLQAEADQKAKEETESKAREKAQQEAKNKITIKEVVETEVIPFTEETKQDASLPKGQTRLVSSGENGEKRLIYEVTYKGNKEQNKVLKKQETSKPPVNKVTAIGTYVYVPPRPAPAPSSPPSSGGVVKLSKNAICHAPGTTYYNQTKNYTGFPSLQACLSAGGRMPKR